MGECITVIMATYNGERYLEEQLESLLQQTCPPNRLVVSDNGSSDDTLAILDRCAQGGHFELVTMARKAPNGTPAFRAMDNFMNAVRHAEGDYFFFCDQDDVWLPTKIERMIARIKELEHSSEAHSPVLVACDFATTDERLHPLVESTFHQASISSKSCGIGPVLAGGVFLGCTMAFNRALLELLRRGEVVPDMWMHDIWAATIAASCGTFDIVPEVLQYYRIHGSNTYATDVRKGGRLSNYLETLHKERGYLQMRSRRTRLALELFEDRMHPTVLPAIRAFAELYDHGKCRRLSTLLRHRILRQEPAALARELLCV